MSATAAAASGRRTRRRFQEQEEKVDNFKAVFGGTKKLKSEEKPPVPTAAAAASSSLVVVSEIDKKKKQLEEAEEKVRVWSKEVEDAYQAVETARQNWEKERDSRKESKAKELLKEAKESLKEAKESLKEAKESLKEAKELEDYFSAKVKELKAEIAAGTTLVGPLRSIASFEHVVQPILAAVRWPDPDNVKLERFTLSSENRHATKINQVNVPMIPGEFPPKPYFLMYELQPDAERILSLKGKSYNNVAVLFAESGAGKTRTLIELLSSRFGTLLVCREPGKYSKNYGSMDITSISNELSKMVPLESDRQARRDLAESGIRCILRTRILVKDSWERAVGRKITPLQWLLVQLHPVHFFERDIFDNLATEVFRKVKEGHHFRLPSAYLVAVDEAQLLAKILQGGFVSSQTNRPNSLRSLLLPVITAVESVGTHPIIAGTGLSMLQTLKSAPGSTTAAPNIYV